jgi:DNA polymerase delta subunit 1
MSDIEDDPFEEVLFQSVKTNTIPSQADLLEEHVYWNRPPVPEFNEGDSSIIFQQFDIQEFLVNKKPAFRIFGVTEEGNSVCCTVLNFSHYFYFPAPAQFEEKHLEQVKDFFRSRLPDQEVRLELVDKCSIWEFHNMELIKYIKITVAFPRGVSQAKRIVEEGISTVDFDNYATSTYESKINYTLRFMIDKQIFGGNWIEIPKGTYEIATNRISRCQIEITTDFSNIISHAPEGEWSKVAPIRILSFDIECAGRPGIFPEPDHDPVIQIANIVQIHGQTKPLIKNIFNLKSCSPIAGVDVHCFEHETQLLEEWSKFISIADPDLIIGYNTSDFDLPYLMGRAQKLNLERFPYLGRVKNYQSKVEKSTFSSKAYGTRESSNVDMIGRIQLDILQVMRRDYKLRSYTLNAVSNHFLGETKEDVHHSIITDLFKKDAESRRRLAVYCLKDALLPLRLMDKLMCFNNYLEMARVTGVPFNYLLSRGQQIKVISQLYRKCAQFNLLIPTLERHGSDGVAYEGATVIEPMTGFHDQPIATLDFASLYPSIMMAHNLCYSTLLKDSLIKKYGLVENVDYIVTPTRDKFVKSSKQRGILPMILEELLAARKRAKADLKKETDPFKRAVLDGRQLALKVSANSVYGFTGATIGSLPCLQISSSVTGFGREMIEETKRRVEESYPGAIVIYGDTDSVMVNFKENDLKEVMKKGEEAAKLISNVFPNPIKLEFEKVYYPYLLIAKKRYAGLYWTKPDKYDKMDTKGIETVRRDNCKLVPTVMDTCLRKLLIEKDVNAAITFVKDTITSLLNNKIDIAQLVISKSLSKASYTNKQPHSELAEKMRKRDPGSAPALGDRVPYVITESSSKQVFARAEDPIYVLENNIAIDTKFYLENQLKGPLERIFKPILQDKTEDLFSGEHTRSKKLGLAKGVASLFKATIVAKCLNCKTPLRDDHRDKVCDAQDLLNSKSPAPDTKGSPAVCQNCKSDRFDTYKRKLPDYNEAAIRFSRLWSECQRCQGSLHQEVICSNQDCDIFYMRKKARKEAKDAYQVKHRFDYEW